MNDNAALQQVTQTPSHLEWIRVDELGYADSDAAPPTEPLCFHCQKPLHHQGDGQSNTTTKLLRCGQCRVACYCDKSCQIQDWKGAGGGKHKASCATYKRAGPDMRGLQQPSKNPAAQAEARGEIFHRIRFYACAYAAFQAATLGRGFLFLQSDQSLVAMSLAIPKDCYGRTLPTPRGILVHYLTMGEFDAEVCRDDFELAAFRQDLEKLVQSYDEQQQVVLLMRFRCGHTAIGTAQLAMPYGSFRKLGSEFFAEQKPPCLQLNIDDV